MPLSIAAMMCLEPSPLLRYDNLFFDTNSKPKKRKKIWKESDSRQRRQIQFAVIYRNLRRNPSEFFTHLNVSAGIFDYILAKTREGLTNIDPDFISPEEKLYMVLKYLKGRVPMKTLAENFGMSTRETESVVENTLTVIWTKLQGSHLRPPSHTKVIELARKYHEKWNFPNCVGALGGKYIRINSKDPDKKSKVNIINIVVDANFRILSVFVSKRKTDEPIAENISYMNGIQCLPNSNTMLPLVLIANEAYQLKNNVMVPYSKLAARIDARNRMFNERLKHAITPVDAAFEILSEKWQVCNSPFTMRLETVTLVVKVCCLLYNVVKDKEDCADPHFSSCLADKGSISLNLVTEKVSNINDSSVAISIRNQLRNYYFYFVKEKLPDTPSFGNEASTSRSETTNTRP